MCLNRSLILIVHMYSCGIWLVVALRMDTKKTCVSRDWIVWSKYANHTRTTGVGGVTYYQLKSMRIFDLIMNKIVISAPNTMRKVDAYSIWNC